MCDPNHAKKIYCQCAVVGASCKIKGTKFVSLHHSYDLWEILGCV